jgi:very-short-patch-repair endonuclease
MANKRKSKERESWIAVAERLSPKSVRRAAKENFGGRYSSPVEDGEPRAKRVLGSVGENLLELLLKAEKISGYDREYQFHHTRKWRFDFAWPLKMVAVEVEGGVWSNGRHTRGKGFIEDCIKYNEATVLGWKVLRVTTDMVKNGEAMKYIEQLVA